ncbi:hypothetical protein VCHENC02_5116B, partial [Vibrio harveyi]
LKLGKLTRWKPSSYRSTIYFCLEHMANRASPAALV